MSDFLKIAKFYFKFLTVLFLEHSFPYTSFRAEPSLNFRFHFDIFLSNFRGVGPDAARLLELDLAHGIVSSRVGLPQLQRLPQPLSAREHVQVVGRVLDRVDELVYFNLFSARRRLRASHLPRVDQVRRVFDRQLAVHLALSRRLHDPLRAHARLAPLEVAQQRVQDLQLLHSDHLAKVPARDARRREAPGPLRAVLRFLGVKALFVLLRCVLVLVHRHHDRLFGRVQVKRVVFVLALVGVRAVYDVPRALFRPLPQRLLQVGDQVVPVRILLARVFSCCGRQLALHLAHFPAQLVPLRALVPRVLCAALFLEPGIFLVDL